MSLEWYLAFLGASGVLLAVPGPTILFVTGCAAANGPRSVLATVPGVALGDMLAMTLSLAGVGAVLQASASLFTLLKFAGAAYLIFLGVRQWRSSPTAAGNASLRSAPPLCLMRRAFAITALNPKSIAFFVAFLPQFLTPEVPLAPQLLILGSTFILMAMLAATIYGLAAARLGRLATRGANTRLMNRVGGAVLIGAGIITATLRRAS